VAEALTPELIKPVDIAPLILAVFALAFATKQYLDARAAKADVVALKNELQLIERQPSLNHFQL
jgi:hypothetical protein